MPRIPISDALGLDIDGKLQPGVKLNSVLGQFSRFQDFALDQIPVDEGRAGLNFVEPLDLSAGNLQLTIEAGVSGSLAVIRREGRLVDERDPFSGIVVEAGEIYVAASLDFTSNAALDASTGPASLGVALNGDFSVKCFHRFRNDGSGFPTFTSALAKVLDAFRIPDDTGSLRQLTPDVVLALAGTGKLAVSGEFAISMPVEALASVAAAGFALQVKPSASLDVSAAITIAGEFEVRWRNPEAATTELGVYRMKSREVDVGISAQAGIRAKAGKFDLAERLIGALSTQPGVDVEEFRNALSGGNGPAKESGIAGFQSSLQGAISSKLQVSLNKAFSACRAEEALWLFEIDWDAANSDDAKAALSGALAGNFAALTANPVLLPAGIKQLRNVLTQTSAREQTLRINLLGLVNILSVAKIAQVSTIERNSTGDITLITDTASASRLEALLQNFARDAQRLRKLMSENFLIQAAYHATGLLLLPPEFKSRHSYLEIHEKTSRNEMKDNLDVARILGLITPEEEARRLGAQTQFGRTTLSVELCYTSEAVRHIFLDHTGNPRTAGYYETRGRSALGALLAGDRGQELRQRYASLDMAGDALWERMKQTGNVASFGELFGLPAGSTDPRLTTAGADYIVITEWARAMSAAAAAVFDVEQTLTGDSVEVNEATLTRMRQMLKERLARVVKKTSGHFGDPLGMIMVYVASGESAARSAVMTGDGIERLEIDAPAYTLSLAAGSI